MNVESGKIKVLGNCASQTKDYETTSFVLDVKGAKILIDAGPGVVKQLYKGGLKATDIDMVIITHCHGDHVLGFPYFAYSNFLERIQGKTGPKVIPVIALTKVHEGLKNMLSFCYPQGFPNFTIENWNASESEVKFFKFKNVKILTIPVTHSVPTIGIQFEFNSVKVTFSSDTAYDEKFVTFAKGSKILVHTALGTKEIAETASRIKQATAEEAGRAAKESEVELLVLTHPLPIYREKSFELITEARKFFDGKVIVPNELDEIEIK
jgi:ribonuclease Z